MKKGKPIHIHLTDIESTVHMECLVSTDIIVGGIGEVFHVPCFWEIDCGKGKDTDKPCPVCPDKVRLTNENSRYLLDFCRMSDSQKKGAMRTMSGCENKCGSAKVIGYKTITELLAMPVANGENKRDYRDKIVYFIGSLASSNLPYKATGRVIAEPKKQKASLIIHKLEKLKTDFDKFELNDDIREKFKYLQPEEHTDVAYTNHMEYMTKQITAKITKIYGEHRERILFLNLLAYHSPIGLKYDGSDIKGTLDVLVIGDTGEGKTATYERLKKAVNIGHFISAFTSSRTGILYNMDTINSAIKYVNIFSKYVTIAA